MKKLVSMLLVIATLLSLTACGGNNTPSDTTTTPDNSTTAPIVSEEENGITETTPEAEPFRFAGTWRLVQKTATPSEKRYIIDEYGNMEYYSGFDSEPSKYTFLKQEKTDDQWIVVFEGNTGWTTSLMFGLVDGHYCITEYDSNERDTQYFYREEDYADYDVVELTTENVAQYLDNSYNIWYHTDDYGEITDIFVATYPTFKKGLGLGSFFLGEVNYNKSYKMLTYDPNTEEYTIGETVSTWEWEYTDEFCFCAIGDYHRSFASAADCQKNDDGTYLLKEIETYEFIGAEKVIGKVFVPKGWNG